MTRHIDNIIAMSNNVLSLLKHILPPMHLISNFDLIVYLSVSLLFECQPLQLDRCGLLLL